METQINLAPSAIPSAISGTGVWDAAMTLVAQSAKKHGFSIIGSDTCAYTSSANFPCSGCAYILDSKIALSFSIALHPSIIFPTIINRLEAAGVEIYRTDLRSTIVILTMA